MIFCWESIGLLLLSLSTVEIELVIVVLDVTLLCLLTVVNGGLDLGAHQGHLGDDTLDLNVLIDEVGFETSWRHVVLAEVTLKIDVVCLDLLWEVEVRTLDGELLLVLLTVVVLHAPHGFVEEALKDLDRFDGTLCDVLAEPWVKVPDFVDVDAHGFNEEDEE